MIKMCKTWMLASALLLANACGDDDPDSPHLQDDAGRDGATPDASTADAGSIDSGAISLDGGLQDAAVAPDATGSDAGPPALAIAGRWHTNFMYTEELDSTMWNGATLIEYDNLARVAYLQNAPTSTMPIGGFNKYVWTTPQNDVFYYCTVEYGLESLAAAKASSKVVDATNPLQSGCGQFGWTQMSPVLELEGSWQSEGASFVIDSDNFADYTVESYDNAADKAVLSSGGVGATTYAKLVWTLALPTHAYYCIVASGLATAAEAASSAATADASNPTSGCNGGSWSSLTR
jgi:hypothetical protein